MKPTSHHLDVARRILFVGLAVAAGVLAYESLRKLVGPQDSADWVYLVYGSVAGILMVVCLGVALKSTPRH